MLTTKNARMIVKLALGESRYADLDRAYTDQVNQADLRMLTFAELYETRERGFTVTDINRVARALKEVDSSIRVYGTSKIPAAAGTDDKYNYLKVGYVTIS